MNGNMAALPEGIETYEQVYKRVCQETNGSTSIRLVHPQLNLREPTERELGEEQEEQTNQKPSFDRSNLPPLVFAQLPSSVLLRILGYVLVFPGKVVHAISRLDPFQSPPRVPTNSSGRVSLYHRFHVGAEKISVMGATKPSRLLASLLVNKRWHFLGSHVFYGENTFAFSSIGE